MDYEQSLLAEADGVVDGMFMMVKENADACPLEPIIKVRNLYTDN